MDGTLQKNIYTNKNVDISSILKEYIVRKYFYISVWAGADEGFTQVVYQL